MKVFLFLGNDGPRRRAGFEAAVAEWRTKVSVMDFDCFDLKEPGQALAAFGALRLGPLDGKQRLVVWKNAHVLTKPTHAMTCEADECVPHTHPDVVLLAEGETGAAIKGKKATLTIPIQPLARLFSTAKTKEFSAAPWWSKDEQKKVVLAMAADAGVKLTDDLAAEMLLLVGNDSGRIGAALGQMALLKEPITKKLLRSLLEGDHADLDAFHQLAVTGKTREALRLIPQFEVAGMKPAEVVIRLQNLALRTLAVVSTKARDDAATSVVSGISERQLYFRRKEWARIKPAKAEAALVAATDLARQLSSGRKLPLPVVLRTYLSLCRAS